MFNKQCRFPAVTDRDYDQPPTHDDDVFKSPRHHRVRHVSSGSALHIQKQLAVAQTIYQHRHSK